MAAALHIAHGAQQHFKVIVVAGKIHFIGIGNQKRRVLVKVEKSAGIGRGFVADSLRGNKFNMPPLRFCRRFCADSSEVCRYTTKSGTEIFWHHFLLHFPKTAFARCPVAAFEHGGARKSGLFPAKNPPAMQAVFSSSLLITSTASARRIRKIKLGGQAVVGGIKVKTAPEKGCAQGLSVR